MLLPMQHNHLKLDWVSPYTVVRNVTPVDYEVETPRGHGTKVYHVNLMKKWHSAQSESRHVCLVLCPNSVNDDAKEDTPVLDLCGEGDLYPEDNASSCETSWKRLPQCSNLNQGVQPLCSIRSMLGMLLPFVRDRTEFHTPVERW